MVINSPYLTDKKELAIPGQTTTGKEFSNPLMADTLPKTTLLTKLWNDLRLNLGRNGTKVHNMVAFLQKPTGSEEFHQIVDFLAVNDGKQQINVTVDGQTISITEASVRRHLQLANADGISSLLNIEIFEQLTLMGYVFNNDKVNFQKGEHIPLFDSMLIHDQSGQGEGPTLPVESQHTPIASPTTSQPTTSQPMSSQEQPSQVPTTEPIITTSSPPLYETKIPHTTSSMPHDSPLRSLEEHHKQTKKVYGKALTNLVKKVKYLEDKLKSTSVRRKARMVISDEEDLVSEDPSKQGRMTETEYEDVDVETEYEEVNAAKILADASRERVKTYKSYTKKRSTVSSRDSTAGVEASSSEPIQEQPIEEPKELSEEELKKMLEIVPVEEIKAEALQLKKDLDKVTSLEKDLKQTKKVYGMALTKLVKKVKSLEDKLKSTTERRKARMVISNDEETDTLLQITPTKVSQGKEQSQESSEVQLDVLTAAKILTDASREKVKTYKSYTRKRRSTVSLRDSTAGGLFSIAEEILIQERQSDTIKRYQTLKKKPVSIAQERKNMMIYLKNMTGYKMGYFKGMSYDEIRPMFEKEYKKMQTLFKKDTEVEKTKTKRVTKETLLQKSFKKLRTTKASSSEPIQEQPTEESKELSKEELKKMLEIVLVEETKVEALQVMYPIID
ncbi:hypothetical protein Tco_0734388 [Tanacetum coccineum]